MPVLTVLCLTLCRRVGHLIKYPLVPRHLNTLNVELHNVLLLIFDSVDYDPELEIAETACRYSSSSSECDIF